MAQKPLPSADVLRQLLDYNPETGELTWKPRDASVFTSTTTHSADALARQFNKKYAGKRALAALDNVGYRSGRLLSSQVRAHRVIWKMVYGYEPKLIDHINQDKKDNRICNLRDVSKAANSVNRECRRNGQITGVTWCANRRKWVAQMQTGGKNMARRFAKKEDAIAYRAELERAFWATQPSAQDAQEDALRRLAELGHEYDRQEQAHGQGQPQEAPQAPQAGPRR